MAFGFSGAHRCGKTTLARLVADDLGMHFHDASVSKIMREAGINAVGDVPPEQRIEAQEFLLRRFLSDLKKAPAPLLTDRTPLDMIGYCLGEVTMHNTTPEQGARINNYVDACINATITHFDTIIIVGPLKGAYTVDPKSPPPNLGYQRLVQMIIEGAAAQVSHTIGCELITTTDLTERRSYAVELLHERQTQLVAESRTVRAN